MRRLVPILLVLFLAACGTAPAAETTPEQPLKVAVSSDLAWLESDLAGCAAEVGAAVLRADETPDGQDVIALQTGAPPEGKYAAVLGEDRLAIIVHPDNPLEELSLESAQAIFTGLQKNWGDQSEIRVWSLPKTGEVTSALTAAGFSLAESAQAPTAADMRAAVAADPSAIGYLPARWLDDSVRELPVDGLKVELPVLALSAQEPQGKARALLLCLQAKIGQ